MNEFEWMSMFGHNLNYILKEKKMTQQELADKAGLSKASISYYISGRRMPSVKALINIGYALDCYEDDLISFVDKIE